MHLEIGICRKGTIKKKPSQVLGFLSPSTQPVCFFRHHFSFAVTFSMRTISGLLQAKECKLIEIYAAYNAGCLCCRSLPVLLAGRSGITLSWWYHLYISPLTNISGHNVLRISCAKHILS